MNTHACTQGIGPVHWLSMLSVECVVYIIYVVQVQWQCSCYSVLLAGSATGIIFSWQNMSCCDKCVFFNTKYVFCCDKNVFVATNIILLQQKFCRDKHIFCRDKRHVLLWQTLVCRDKLVFVATKHLSRQKWYLYQLPPIIIQQTSGPL